MQILIDVLLVHAVETICLMNNFLCKYTLNSLSQKTYSKASLISVQSDSTEGLFRVNDIWLQVIDFDNANH